MNFYWRKAFNMMVLTICGKEECLVKIRFSPHLYILRDLTLMRKLTI
jgi:hypothetical protein